MTLKDGADDNPYRVLSPRSELIATYAVCGFGNISSVGIQIGVLSTLAPGRAGRVAKVAISALISGIFATLSSASIAGMLLSDGLVVDAIKASNDALTAGAAAAAAAEASSRAANVMTVIIATATASGGPAVTQTAASITSAVSAALAAATTAVTSGGA